MIGAIIAKRNVTKAFQQLNNKDLTAFMASWADDGLFYYPGNLTVSGTYRGKAEVESWFAHFLEFFDQIHFKLNHICIENMFDVSGNNNVVAQWSIELTGKSGRKISNVGINLIKIRNRKVSEVRDFFFHMDRLPVGWEEPGTQAPITLNAVIP